MKLEDMQPAREQDVLNRANLSPIDKNSIKDITKFEAEKLNADTEQYLNKKILPTCHIDVPLFPSHPGNPGDASVPLFPSHPGKPGDAGEPKKPGKPPLKPGEPFNPDDPPEGKPHGGTHVPPEYPSPIRPRPHRPFPGNLGDLGDPGHWKPVPKTPDFSDSRPTND